MASDEDPSMDTALPGGAPSVFPRGSLGRPEIYREQVKEQHAKAAERPVANSLRK
jgi:hypothetical protein